MLCTIFYNGILPACYRRWLLCAYSLYGMGDEKECLIRVGEVPKLLTLTAIIAEQLGRISERKSQAHELRLRRINRLQTIQGSLAIEGNSLSIEQITAVILAAA